MRRGPRPQVKAGEVDSGPILTLLFSTRRGTRISCRASVLRRSHRLLAKGRGAPRSPPRISRACISTNNCSRRRSLELFGAPRRDTSHSPILAAASTPSRSHAPQGRRRQSEGSHDPENRPAPTTMQAGDMIGRGPANRSEVLRQRERRARLRAKSRKTPREVRRRRWKPPNGRPWPNRQTRRPSRKKKHSRESGVGDSEVVQEAKRPAVLIPRGICCGSTALR